LNYLGPLWSDIKSGGADQTSLDSGAAHLSDAERD